MRTNSLFLFLISLFIFQQATAEEIILSGATAQQKINGTNLIRYTNQSTLPNFIQFNKNNAPAVAEIKEWMQANLQLSNDYDLQLLNQQTDKLGFTHLRYRQTFKGLSIATSMLILHVRNNVVESMNGEIYNNVNATLTTSISEAAALNFALQKINAVQYKWQIAAEENRLKQMQHNPSAAYFPKGNLEFLKTANGFNLCYVFNIFADEPMGRTMEYVDATSGKILFSQNLIQTVGVTGTAATKYSGIRSIKTDSISPTVFHLYDATRGNGINTLNMQNTSKYSTAVSFVDADNYWNNVNTAQDEAATDAHWGAEMTYDYYWVKHNRNSIDNNGLSLNSYLHYKTNYTNANWNGSEMTYGDGNVSQGTLIFTALDVCGHEITHGLTSYTASLGGGGTSEADALNEGYSDIFGTCIERFARPTQWDWIMGADFTCNSSGVHNHAGLRNMSDPSLSTDGAQPICYLGNNWDVAGEPHNNNGPLIYWFYLLSTGDANYSVNALGVDTASEIAYRTLTTHLTSHATYADARFYSIQSATELYGCSDAAISTVNAWNEVCVGDPYTPPIAYFTASDVSGTENFNNLSTDATKYAWTFNDGSNNITTKNPSHTFSTPGSYKVILKVYSIVGCVDSFSQTINVYAAGINNLTNANNYVQCVPNPFNNQFNISFAEKDFSGTIEVYSTIGQLMLKEEVKKCSTFSIDATKWSNGNYFVKLNGNNANSQLKIVKQ